MTQIPPAWTRGKGLMHTHKQFAIWLEMSRSQHEKWNHSKVFTFFFSILREILQDHRALGTSGREPACQCRRHKRCGFDPWVRRSPGGGHGNPLQYSCLENLTDRGAWWATVHGVTKSWTSLKWLSMQAQNSENSDLIWTLCLLHLQISISSFRDIRMIFGFRLLSLHTTLIGHRYYKYLSGVTRWAGQNPETWTQVLRCQFWWLIGHVRLLPVPDARGRKGLLRVSVPRLDLTCLEEFPVVIWTISPFFLFSHQGETDPLLQVP